MAIRKHRYGWEVDVTSRRLSIRIKKIVKTRAAARALEAELREDLRRRAVPGGGLEQALERYLKGEASTLKDYAGILSKSRAILPYIEGRTFDQIGAVQSEIKSNMLSAGLKPATINRRLALLRRLYNLAFEWGWLREPIGRRIKLLPGETARHYYLTPDQVEALAGRCPQTGSLIRIAAYTGLRRSELLALRPEDFTQDFITIGPHTKTATPRLVPIPDRIRPDIEATDWPLPAPTDHRLRVEFEAAREAAGLSHIRFHDLRHTYASLLAQAGATLQLIGQAMGHSTPVMTQRYAHLISDNLKSLAKKFA